MDNYAMDSYGNAFAFLFDLVNSDKNEVKAAVALLGEYAQNDEPVLEAGVGTGRVAIPLAETGIPVYGVEISEKMAERLRAKPEGHRVRLVVGDMATVRFDVSFGLIYIAQGGLHSLLTGQEQTDCLKNLAGQLKAGGHLVIESLTLDQSRFTRDQYLDITMMDVGYVALSAAVHEPEQQVVNVQSILISQDGVQLFPLRYRHYSPTELDAMAAQAGLTLLGRWSDWDKTPPHREQKRFISVYTSA
ncbi:class I SAM-dependent methyltransferase [Streptomyces sp. NPDC048312]|uniref:Methyltransferase n=1 Tax=Streptomyces melanovinaceus TaxID=1182637 RepID=A0A060NU83_9ACTN|nr:methyltransferase [Streptomyces melanovinaceus]BAO84860.1 putative N-methyltransferase [Streptomyces melanovinaceus]